LLHWFTHCMPPDLCVLGFLKESMYMHTQEAWTVLKLTLNRLLMAFAKL
jgi:hypothetical protein